MSIIPTPAIETKTIDAQQITRTTWTMGDYTLIRTEREGAGNAYWSTRRLNNDAPRVDEDAASWYDETAPITYSVNWSSSGDRSPEAAFEYAAHIMAAANAARIFTTIRAENQ